MTNQLLAELEALQQAKDKLQNDYQEARDRIDEFKLTITTQQQMIDELINKIDKAIGILKDTSVDMPSTLLIETIDYARHILGDKE